MYRALLAVILSVCFLLPANAATPSKKELTDRLITAFEIKESTKFNISEIVNIIIKKDPQFTPYREVLNDFYTKYLTWDGIQPIFEEIIMTEFTQQDLLIINKFLDSPAFKAWIAAEGDIRSLAEPEKEGVIEFISSDEGTKFIKVTEEFIKASNKFVGDMTLEHKDELDKMMDNKTNELVK